MSAYVVSDNHITELVRAAVSDRRDPMSFYLEGERHEVTPENAEQWGHVLKAQNQRSVDCRYGDDANGRPGVIGEADSDWVSPGRSLTGPSQQQPGRILGAIDTYEYQACEDAQWELSLAHAFIRALQRRMIRRLPDYEWGEFSA